MSLCRAGRYCDETIFFTTNRDLLQSSQLLWREQSPLRWVPNLEAMYTCVSEVRLENHLWATCKHQAWDRAV